MHVRFRIALGAHLAALLGVLVFRNGDASMSRGQGGNARRTYRCPHCKETDSSSLNQRELPFCARCDSPMDLVDDSADPSSDPEG